MRFTAGVATRTSDGSMLGGDLTAVASDDHGLGVMVLDVAGNGWAAAREAWRVRPDVDAAARLDPTVALRKIDGLLHGGRGAVGIAARFEPAGRLRYAGVGDVRAHRWRGGGLDSMHIRPGQLGGACPTLTEVTGSVQIGDLYVFVTDGVRTSMTLPPHVSLRSNRPELLADELLSSWARDHDDATCVVVEVGR